MLEAMFEAVMQYLGPAADSNEVAWALGLTEDKMNEDDKETLRKLRTAITFDECISIFLHTNNKAIEYRALTKAIELSTTPFQLKDVWAYTDSFPLRNKAIQKLALLLRENGKVSVA